MAKKRNKADMVNLPKYNFIKLGVVNSKPSVITLILTDGNRIEIPETLALSLLPNLLSVLKPIR